MPRNRSEITLVQVLLAAPVSTAVGAPPGLVTFVTAVIASISVAPTVTWVIASVRAMFARQVEAAERALRVAASVSALPDVESEAHRASRHRRTARRP